MSKFEYKRGLTTNNSSQDLRLFTKITWKFPFQFVATVTSATTTATSHPTNWNFSNFQFQQSLLKPILSDRNLTPSWHSFSLSLSLLNVSVYFRNNKTVNKTSRFFSFSLIMHRHLFWGGNTFRFVEFWRKKSEWQNLAKRFFLALIMSFSYSTGTSAKVWVVTSGKQFCVTRVAA